jgi:hypothetical protein
VRYVLPPWDCQNCQHFIFKSALKWSYCLYTSTCVYIYCIPSCVSHQNILVYYLFVFVYIYIVYYCVMHEFGLAACFCEFPLRWYLQYIYILLYGS